ncbi:MAG TPA: NAD(P)/FAD-dependent oxidoreductase [Ramlibacter sp.]|nr:NAD(P)/FAD-dependent oxidoreductase [Ramlibacter sp.]
MTDTTSHDLVVIGAGVAGLAAARAALRAGLSVAWLEAQMFGGLIMNVNELDGAMSGSGSDFASDLMMQAAELGGESLDGAARGVEPDGDGLVVTSDSGRHRARAVIVASGASLRKLGVPGEAELEYRGVSHCADCDGPMFQGRLVVVAGGGDSALQSALVLAKFCSRVVLVHRGGEFSAKPQFVAAVAAEPRIEARLHSEVTEVVGGDTVEGVRINGEVVPCHGFLAQVGLEPATAFLAAQVARDARGALLVSDDLETAMPNVFAAGAARAGCGGMIEDAMRDGESAARAVVQRLGNQKE